MVYLPTCAAQGLGRVNPPAAKMSVWVWVGLAATALVVGGSILKRSRA